MKGWTYKNGTIYDERGVCIARYVGPDAAKRILDAVNGAAKPATSRRRPASKKTAAKG